MWQVLAAGRFNLFDEPQVWRGVPRMRVASVRAGALGGGGEALLLACGRLLPRGRDEAHAAHALDRLQDVDRAAHGPPAVPRGLHEGEAATPGLAREGRRIADESSGGDIE